MSSVEEGGSESEIETGGSQLLMLPQTSNRHLNSSDSASWASQSDGQSEMSFGSKPYVPPHKVTKRNMLCILTCKILEVLRNGVLMIPVLLVLCIIILDFYVLMIVEVPKRYSSEPTRCILIIMFWIPTIILLLISYFRTVFTSSAVEDHPPPVYMDKLSCPRCWKCSSLKPVRAHHCSICRKCILKMDHHCPWVANCVGFYNYKFFCLFIFYAEIGCIIFLIGVWRSVTELFSGGDDAKATASRLFATVFTFTFALTLLFFGGFHISLVLRNTTTLEANEINRFNKGSFYYNWVSVFGPRPSLWFLPVQTVERHKGWGWNKYSQCELSLI